MHIDVGDVDLSDLDFWARPLAERDAALAVLRSRPGLPFYAEPVPLGGSVPPGPGYWAVLRHADVDAVSRQPETYSSAGGTTTLYDMPPEFLEYFGSMINMDGPRHLARRRIVSRAFSPRMLARIEAEIAEVTRRVVDDMIAAGPGDSVAALAARVPLEVICAMLGLPAERQAEVFRCSNVITGQEDPEYLPAGVDPVQAVAGALGQLAELFGETARQRRAEPTGDLVTALVEAEVDGQRLTDAELASVFVLLVLAGNETSRNAISAALLALTGHPDQRAAWQADFDALAPTAVDEIVRWSSPINWMRRTATADTELAGQRIAKGDKVLLFYSSANRDEAVFADPYAFDLRRDPNPHLGFGGGGPHYCLGAHLARRQITEVYRELFARLPDIRAVGEPVRMRSSLVTGFTRLACDFTVP